MINETQRKAINVDKPNLIPLWTFKQNDDAVLNISLFKESVMFDVTGQTIRLGAKTSNGLKEQIDGFTIQGNNIDIALKNTILVPGIVEIDLEFTDAEGKMTSASFFINVNKKVLNDTAVEATNEFGTFKKTVEEIQGDYKGLKAIIIDENNAANLQNQVNEVIASLEQINEKLYINKPKYIGVASHAYYPEDIEIHLNKYKEINCDLQLVCYISVPTNNGTTLEATCLDEARSWFTRANDIGVKCSLLKVHLVKNNSDGSPKGDIYIEKGNEELFFSNYKTELIKYLNLCLEFNIENFVFGNESRNIFTVENFSYYSPKILELKSQYKSINFSYSLSGDEVKEYLIDKKIDETVLDLCDFISINMYPSISKNTTYNYKETENSYKNKAYKSFYSIYINNAKNWYNKNVFITETGCMGRENSLSNPIDQSSSLEPKNDVITGIYYNIVTSCFAEIDKVEGFFIWSAREPFEFFDTSGEEFLKRYCLNRRSDI